MTRELIRIRQALSVDDGKPFFTTTKNRETRDIDMPGKLKLVLTRHLEHIQQERQDAGNIWEATGAVFPTVIGRWTHPTYLHATLTDLILWSDPNKFAKRSEGIRRRVGSQALASLEAAVMSGSSLPKVSPHDLRHTFATLALKSGQDVVDVSEILGHRDVSVTLKFYAHAIKLKEKKTFDLFAAPIPERQVRILPIA